MKLFNTIQELWDYCVYCPICTRNCREIAISVGPDSNFILVDYKKQNNDLILQCTYKKRREIYSINYTINCLDNSFQIGTPAVIELGPDIIAKPEKVKGAYFYFFIEGICNECDSTSASSRDLEFDRVDSCIVDIGLERENFYLFDTGEKYHVTPIHDRNVMLVSHLYPTEDMSYTESSKPIELPLVKLDLTDQAKTINKIKTLILFS